MHGQRQGVRPPVGVESEQGAQCEAAHPRLGAAIEGAQTPVVVALLPLHVDVGIRRAVVGLLIDDETLAAGVHQSPVGVGVPDLDLDRDRRDLGRQQTHAFHEIVLGDDAGVFARPDRRSGGKIRRETGRDDAGIGNESWIDCSVCQQSRNPGTRNTVDTVE